MNDDYERRSLAARYLRSTAYYTALTEDDYMPCARHYFERSFFEYAHFAALLATSSTPKRPRHASAQPISERTAVMT